MQKHPFLIVLILLSLAACQVKTALPSTTPAPPSPTATVTKTSTLTATLARATASPIPSNTPSQTPVVEPLPPFTIDWTQPFAQPMMSGENITVTAWTAQPYAGEQAALPFQLEMLANPQVMAGLTEAQKTFLAQNGFVVIHSQEAQFGDIRIETAVKTGQPYYLTTDAAYHALHLLFDDLLKAMERENFRLQILTTTQAAVDQLQADLPQVKGTTLEAETQLSLAYLSVALKLFDPAAGIHAAVKDLVAQQVDQINAADGKAKSVLFPDFEDDYSAYQPVGHYAGDPDLEAYFRGMTWFGRMHFLLSDPTNPAFVPSRLPLIVTLALRQAQLNGYPASDSWALLHRTLTFMVGPSDDAGPLEYAALMDQVYGPAPLLTDLADPARWQDFLSRSGQLPVPHINSLFIASTRDLSTTKGWRFLGQRFTLDGQVLQNVIFDRVQDKPDGTRRLLPSGLDVMAVFDSSPARSELFHQKIADFPGYQDQFTRLYRAVQDQPEAQWLTRFYDGWLYSFLPVLQSKQVAFPAYMRTSAWGYKELNAALGSWAELKHDTVLYTKMPEGAGGGGPPMSYNAPSLVEPNPLVFYRLSYIARMLSCGLQNQVIIGPCGGGPGGEDATGYIYSMYALGIRFEELGNIAAKELAGQPLTQEDVDAVTTCLGFTECIHVDSPYNRPSGEMPKVPVIAAVAGSQDDLLEVGVGLVDRIYVLVPLEGKWEVAQGGVFSYYEFTQPRDQRLTDEDWRAKLASGTVDLPDWAQTFVLTGGKSAQSLFFRVGDVYIITAAGDKLNVHDSPSINATVVVQLRTGDYVTISEGPVVAEGHTWWKLDQGWAIEDQEWYERSYLP